MEALGIDLGHTIYDNPNRREFTDSFRVIKRLTTERFGDKIFIVSKVNEIQEVRARAYVSTPAFFTGTGIPIERAHFCRERSEKGAICEKLNITHFIDDRPEVMDAMPRGVIVRILFQPRDEDLKKYPEMVNGTIKDHCTFIVYNWQEIEKLLLH